MRTHTLLFLLFLYPPLLWSQETIKGDIHAVIGADGSISYYLKTAPGTINNNATKAISKPAINQLVSKDTVSPKAFEIFGAKNELTGYYVSPASSDKIEPVTMAINKGYTAKSVPYDSLPESFNQAYKFTNQKGEIGGAWLPASEGRGVSALAYIIPTDWSTSKLSAPSSTMQTSENYIPIPRDELIKSLGETMFQQAVLLACKSRIAPKEIAVTASLAASVGFIVGGEGTISFQATWETEKICKP
ncbi:hypothetical protein [Pseudomonas serbica]